MACEIEGVHAVALTPDPSPDNQALSQKKRKKGTKVQLFFVGPPFYFQD
jgi:hypothetical protein